jgi:2,4-dienoyl-CoA reductase-like NADH-dependent reductase (Old Yellow Enzyme family)
MSPGLFSPFSLRDLTLGNRIVVGPMCQYSAVEGSATDWHLMHLGKLATSGAGLVMTESAHVESIGRITHGCLGLYSDANEAALEPVLDFCRRHGSAKLGVQLSHAGRKASTRLPWEGRAAPLTENGWPTVGCSGQPRASGWPDPAPLDGAAMTRIRNAHVNAVARARRLDFDLVELVMAHGYLLHEFLSPQSNHRTDSFGGTLKNRMAFPLSVFAAMRAEWPDDKPMGVRVSATDWLEDGWTPEDTAALTGSLKAMGCDYIAVSTGGLSLDQNIPLGEGHQVSFAADLRQSSDLPVMAMGMIEDPHHANKIIADGAADMVALARVMLSDPHWPWRAAAVLGQNINYPPQYLRGYRSTWLRTRRAVGTEYMNGDP